MTRPDQEATTPGGAVAETMDQARATNATNLRAAGARLGRAALFAVSAVFAAGLPCAAFGAGPSGAALPVSTQYYPGCDCCPPCESTTPHVVVPGPPVEVVPGEPLEGETPADQPSADLMEGFDAAEAFDEPSSTLPSGAGAVAAAESPSVHMIGDFFGSGYFFVGGMGNIATAAIAGGDRRFKATDNLSPLPQDRVFFNYHHFHHAVIDATGAQRSVDRFTFGLERAFFDDMLSFEVRAPFDDGLNSTQWVFGDGTTTSEFGNLALTVKARLCECGAFTLTSGLATTLPTADDSSFSEDDDTGAPQVVLENKAVHLQPYLGLNFSDPCSRWFSTGYVAVDVDVNGNALLQSNPFASVGAPLVFSGDVRDQTLLFVDWQIGYWCYQDYGHIGYLNAVAPVLELHYTQALDAANNNNASLQNPFGRVSLLNLTAGLVFDIRRYTTLSVYGAAPLLREETMFMGREVSPVFQSEFGLQLVHRY